MTYTRDELETICKRREDAAWGNGLSWGVTLAGVVFLFAVLANRVWG